jgi:YVTN family beta-propeller protein
VQPARVSPLGKIVAGRIALSPDSKTLFSANGPSIELSVVNPGNLNVIKKIKVGDEPQGVAVLPAKN